MSKQGAKIKIVFFGTPDFAVPSLQKLLNAQDIKVLAVITQTDKAVGRKQIINSPPIKILATKNHIPIYQPKQLNSDQELIKKLQELKPDFIITVAYGQILKAEILDIAPVINLHASLLPDYRGPAPINWSIIHGETDIGLSTMLSDAGVDTGDMLLKSETPLGANENAEELTIRLAELGSDLLLKTIREFTQTSPAKQTTTINQKTLAPFMDKNLGAIDFQAQELIYKSPNPKQADFEVIKKNSAVNIHNLVRGTYPWPGAYFMRNDDKIIITKTQINKINDQAKPGTIIDINKEEGSILIQTQEGILEIFELKPQGKIVQRASDWLNGQRLKRGDLL